MSMGSYDKKTRTETEKSLETFLITTSLGQTHSLIESKITAFKQAGTLINQVRSLMYHLLMVIIKWQVEPLLPLWKSSVGNRTGCIRA